MAYDESTRRMVIVGENGKAGQAKTNQELTAALSVSVWDLSNMRQPVMACMAGPKQVSCALVRMCMRMCLAHICIHTWTDIFVPKTLMAILIHALRAKRA